MASIFSKIVAREIPAHIVAENEHFMAFLDVFPTAEGHTLVIPKKEVDYIFDLDETTYTELMLFSRRVASAVEKAIPCRRVGIAVVGLEVPHVHVHLIPLNSMADMNFNNKLKFSNDELARVAERIRAAF